MGQLKLKQDPVSEVPETFPDHVVSLDKSLTSRGSLDVVWWSESLFAPRTRQVTHILVEFTDGANR